LFVQGFSRGLGVTEDVTSPTFALMNQYHGRMPVTQNAFFDTNEAWYNYLYPPQVKIDFSFLPINLGRLKIGFGLDLMGMPAEVELLNLNNCIVKGNYGLLNLDLAFRYNLVNEKLFIGAKAGAGLSLFKIDISYSDYEERQRTSSPYYVLACANGELSLIFLPWRGFIMELGASYQHVFTGNTNFNIIAPFLSMGVRL